MFKLNNYFENINKSNLDKTIEYLQKYMDIEDENLLKNTFNECLVDVYSNFNYFKNKKEELKKM